jgi:hypothetical protein
VRVEIVRRVADGERLRAICGEAGMPCCESVTGWARRDLAGFGAELRAAYAGAAYRRRHTCDVGVAKAILAELGQGRRLEDVVRAPGAPSLRTFLAWKQDHAWIAEAHGLVRAGRETARREKVRSGRWRAFDPAVAHRLYVRLWTGEGLRRVLRSDKAFPSLMVFARWRRENSDFDAQMRFVLGGWRKKRARERGPYTPEMADAITDAIVLGESLRSVAARPDMPSARAMYGWVRTKPEFAAEVARACEIREQWYQDQIFALDLTATPGTVREVRRLTAPLRKQVTRLRKRPGWKARKAAGGAG